MIFGTGWLERIAAEYVNGIQPANISIMGEQHLVASNGRCLVGLAGLRNDYPEFEGPLHDAIIRRMKMPFGAVQHDTELVKLKAWAGRAEYDKPCRSCDGDGFYECPDCGNEIPCPRCEGLGGRVIMGDTAYLFEIPINKNLLAKCLDGIYGNEPVTVHTAGKKERVTILGLGWRAVFMPVLPEKEKTIIFDAFGVLPDENRAEKAQDHFKP